MLLLAPLCIGAIQLAFASTVEPANSWQSATTARASYGWSGGDSDTSISLDSDGRYMMFVFADSFIGNLNQDNRQRIGSKTKMPHNSIGWV